MSTTAVNNTVSIVMKKSGSGDTVALAKQKQQGLQSTRSNASNKLKVVVDQMRFLHEQAQKILEETAENTRLHSAQCKMIRIPGHLYHLYRRKNGALYWSLITPEDWQSNLSPCPSVYEGSYRLEVDQSWTAEENLETRDKENNLFDQILKTQLSIADCTIDRQDSVPVKTHSKITECMERDGKKPEL